MKKTTILDGHICTKEERMIRCYGVPFGFIVMLVFACVLWMEATRNIGSLLHWLFAGGWSAFVASLIVIFCRSSDIAGMQFYINEFEIGNICAKRNTRIELSENVYFTMYTCDFAYGKATVSRSFYLFSLKPFEDDYIKGEGLFVIKQLNKCGVIVIPRNKETDAWIVSVFKIPEFPSYPKIGRTGDGSVVPQNEKQF